MTPTCRYGHGEMEIISGKNSPGLYAFPEIEVIKKQEGSHYSTTVNLTGHQFAFYLYRCKECKYMELRDE